MELLTEKPSRKTLGTLSQIQSIEADLSGFVNRFDHCGYPLMRWVEHAMAAVLHDIENSTPAGGDDRNSTGECFDRRDPEIFDPGLEEELGAAVGLAKLFATELTQPAHGRAADPFQA